MHFPSQIKIHFIRSVHVHCVLVLMLFVWGAFCARSSVSWLISNSCMPCERWTVTDRTGLYSIRACLCHTAVCVYGIVSWWMTGYFLRTITVIWAGAMHACVVGRGTIMCIVVTWHNTAPICIYFSNTWTNLSSPLPFTPPEALRHMVVFLLPFPNCWRQSLVLHWLLTALQLHIASLECENGNPPARFEIHCRSSVMALHVTFDYEFVNFSVNFFQTLLLEEVQ